MLAVIRHAVEQVAAPDAGGVLPVAGSRQQAPRVADGRTPVPGGGVGAAAAHHGHKRHGVLMIFVQGVNGHGAGVTVYRQKVGEALLLVQRHTGGGVLRCQRFHGGAPGVVPGGGVGDLRRVLGGVGGGCRHGGRNGRLRGRRGRGSGRRLRRRGRIGGGGRTVLRQVAGLHRARLAVAGGQHGQRQGKGQQTGNDTHNFSLLFGDAVLLRHQGFQGGKAAADFFGGDAIRHTEIPRAAEAVAGNQR